MSFRVSRARAAMLSMSQAAEEETTQEVSNKRGTNEVQNPFASPPTHPHTCTHPTISPSGGPVIILPPSVHEVRHDWRANEEGQGVWCHATAAPSDVIYTMFDSSSTQPSYPVSRPEKQHAQIPATRTHSQRRWAQRVVSAMVLLMRTAEKQSSSTSCRFVCLSVCFCIMG